MGKIKALFFVMLVFVLISSAIGLIFLTLLMHTINVLSFFIMLSSATSPALIAGILCWFYFLIVSQFRSPENSSAKRRWVDAVIGGICVWVGLHVNWILRVGVTDFFAVTPVVLRGIATGMLCGWITAPRALRLLRDGV